MYIYIYYLYMYIYESTWLWGPPWKHTKTNEKAMKTIGKPWETHWNHRHCKSINLGLYLLSCMCVLRLLPSRLLLPILTSRRHHAFVLPMSECNWTLTVYTTCLCHKWYKILCTKLNTTSSHHTRDIHLNMRIHTYIYIDIYRGREPTYMCIYASMNMYIYI